MTTDAPTMLDVLISTPLEAELVPRIAAADPRIRVHYEPELLPPPLYPGDHAGDPEFRRDAEGQRRWNELLGQAEALFGIPPDVGLRGLLDSCPRLRFVQGMAAGTGEAVRKARLDAETLQRVAVATTAGVHAVPLAEFAIMGLLALAKDVRGLERNREAHRWPPRRHATVELRGKTMLLLGLGGIGEETARMASALGMRVLGVRRHPAPVPYVDEVHPPERLTELASRADALVVTLPLTAATEKMVDATVLDALPRGAWVVNVGRGGVIDEAAMTERLRSGQLGGAALDVFATEPLPEDSPLWDLPNVIVSPHIAALSPHENERIVDVFCDNLRRLLKGESLRNRILPDRPY